MEWNGNNRLGLLASLLAGGAEGKNFPCPLVQGSNKLRKLSLKTRNLSCAPPYNWIACKSSLCNAGANPWLTCLKINNK